MRALVQDLSFAARQLRRSPGFAGAAVLCLCLGIGGNTAVFSFATSFLLDDRGVTAPDRLVWLMVEWKEGLKWGAWSRPDYEDLRSLRAFTGVAAETPRPFHLGVQGQTERLWGSEVSGDYFSLLGVVLPLGRALADDDERLAAPVIVLSHGLWQRRFGGDPGVVGRTVTVNGRTATVLGVAPPAFRSANVGLAPELWVPLRPSDGGVEARASHGIAFVMARLAPGFTPGQAQTAVDALMSRLAEAHPESNTGKSARVYGHSEAALHPMVQGAFVSFLGLLFAVVALVLLLACANVAGLLLARAAARRGEIAMRLALGASRGRLVRQLLTESLLLSCLGGGAGLLLGVLLTDLLGTLQPPIDLPLDFSVRRLDPAVLAFSLAVALATGLLFGLAPALDGARVDLVSSLRGRSASLAASRLRRGLVTIQVAFSVVLLVGAGLALTSLSNAARVDLGFEPDGQLLAPVDLGLQGRETDREVVFESLRRRALALPGVEAAGYGGIVPLSVMNYQTGVVPEGYDVPPGVNAPTIDYSFAGPGYLEALGLAVRAGRSFRDEEPPGRRVAVVNEAFVRRFWPQGEPLGRRVNGLEVVGVVEDAKYWTIGEAPRPFLYMPIRDHASRTLHVRTGGDATALVGPLRQEIAAVDPTLPAAGVTTMREHLRFTLFPVRLLAGSVAGFAALALLLAAVGLYGVVAFWVSQATREIGIRRALGAREQDVRWLVVRRALPLVGAGLVLGLAAAVALTRVATRILYGVDPLSPGTYLAAAAVLVTAALVACVLPALRASRVDPALALRAE